VFRRVNIWGKCVWGCSLALLMLLPLNAAHARFKVLHAFASGSDGDQPIAGLLIDSSGNLYGTTQDGGEPAGYGTVFKITPDGTETVLHSFCQPPRCLDGALPSGGLIEDGTGNLYGTAFESCGGFGCVYKLAPDGTETMLYSFGGGNDGGYPKSDLIMDKAGNLYGTTMGGAGCIAYGCGTVFKLAPDGTKTLLHGFIGGSDGWNPQGGVIRDKAGNLYGTTWAGGGTGCDGLGCGTVFKLAPDGTETVLYAFQGGSDGANSSADLMMDDSGNLYGTTFDGGRSGCNGQGCGTVFKLAPDGTETVLYAFTGGSDGGGPAAGLIKDSAGNLYATTEFEGAYGYGTVFMLAPDGTETVLHSFTGGSDGAFPLGRLAKDKHGHLVGTATQGGVDNYPNGYGTVFRLKK